MERGAVNGPSVVAVPTGIKTMPPLLCRRAIDYGPELGERPVSTKPREDPRGSLRSLRRLNRRVRQKRNVATDLEEHFGR